MAPDNALLAVRSSALEEDGSHHSFAGQFTSLLDVHSQNLAAAVTTVRNSGKSERASTYCRRHGLPMASPPAVIVQRMVPADVSGVAFGVDPVRGDRGMTLISAVTGTSQDMMEGSQNADTWHLDAAGNVVSRQPQPGTTGPPMDDASLQAVARLVRRAGEVCGIPQDVEWALHAGRLYLLQSRPVTALPLEQESTLWDNSNIVESYGGITLPLTFSFARRAYAAVYRQFCRILSVPARRIATGEPIFTGMLGHIRGRVYYNLLNWYRLLAMLPGYRLNRTFMEQMMGVREPLPEELAERIASEGKATGPFGRLLDGLHVARGVASLLVAHGMLPLTIQRFRRRIDKALQPPQPALAERTAASLMAHFGELEDRLLHRWDAPLLNDFLAMIFFGILRKLTAAWAGDQGASLHNHLLCGEGSMISAEPASRLRHMATLASGNPAIAAALRSGSMTSLADAMETAPDFTDAWHSYLGCFGERCLGELKLENLTLHDDPQALLEGVARMLDGNTHENSGQAASMRSSAEQRASESLRGHPFRRIVFAWVLSHARARVRDRENLRFERTRVFGRARQIFKALGERLHSSGSLDKPQDVFLLEISELEAATADASAAAALRSIVARRRSTCAAWEAAPAPPDRFFSRGNPEDSRRWESRTQPSMPVTNESKKRHGTGCCPGLVRGHVRRITDPRSATLSHGEILVAERTDPGWILLFPAAAAILVERGSLLSHSAIVARELGIPAVVAVPGLMSWLKDGDEILCDGSTGEIILLQAAAATPHQEASLK